LAFACHPHSRLGGEHILGWNMIKQAGRCNQDWALTSAQNCAGIEAEMQRESIPNAQFRYVDLPRWLQGLLQFQRGPKFFCLPWQMKAFLAARRLHQQVGFDLFHHVTYANDWMASFIGAQLAFPYIREPGGGAHRTPQKFLRVRPVGNQQKWDAFVKERSRGYGSVVGLREQVVVAFATG